MEFRKGMRIKRGNMMGTIIGTKYSMVGIAYDTDGTIWTYADTLELEKEKGELEILSEHN